MCKHDLQTTSGWQQPLLPADVSRWIQDKATNFVEEELRQRGCIEVEDLPDADLSNPVHPIFYYRNFLNLTAPEYRSIEAALVLASRFLTEDTMLDWWIHTHQGKPTLVECRAGAIEYLQKGPTEGLRDAALLSTRSELLKLAGCVQFFILPGPVLGETRSCYGLTFSDELTFERWARKNFGLSRSKHDNSDPASPDGQFMNIERRSVVALNWDWRRSMPIDEDESTMCQQVRYQFQLASTMVHEVAHAFYNWTHPTTPFIEPLHSLDPDEGYELGFSWERWALGISPFPWNMERKRDEKRSAVASTVLYTSYTSEHGENRSAQMIEDRASRLCDGVFSGPRHDSTVLPMAYINSWFTESTWMEIRKLGREEGRPRLGRAPVLVRRRRCGEEVWDLESLTHEDFPRHRRDGTVAVKVSERWLP